MARLNVLLVAVIALSSCGSLVTSQNTVPKTPVGESEKVTVWVPAPKGGDANRRVKPGTERDYSSQFGWPASSSNRRVAAPKPAPLFNTDFGWAPRPNNDNARVKPKSSGAKCIRRVKKNKLCGKKKPLPGFCCVSGTTCTKVKKAKWVCKA